MSSSVPQPTSSQQSGKAILIRALIVLFLAGAGGGYAYYLYSRPKLREVLAQGEMALASNDLKKAESVARQAQARAPRAPETIVYVAQVNIAQKKYDEALELLRQVPDGTPDTAGARAIQGMVEMVHLGKLAEAEELFKKSLEQDPNHDYSLRNYAGLLRLATRTMDRTKVNLRLLELQQVSPALMFELAYNWNLRTNINQIEEMYRKNPADPNILLGMADGTLAQGQFGDAEKYLREALKRAPEELEVHSKLGQAYLGQNQYAKLLEWQKSLPSNAETHPGIWQVRGEWALNRGDIQGAARCFWEAAKIDINYSRADYYLGQALTRLKRENDGKQFLDRAKKIEEYTAKVHALNSVSNGKPQFEMVRPLLTDTINLGLPWEALGWAELLIQLQEDEEVNKIGQKLYDSLKGEAGRARGLARTYPQANIALKLDLSEYSLPDWEKLGVEETTPVAETASNQPVAITFEDQAKSLGIDFQYFNSADKRLRGLGRAFEFTGGGVAVLDYDQDGYSDLYFTQGCVFPAIESNTEYTDRLYRNLGNGKFEDVTVQAGISENRYSQGVSVGDVNNDGYPDLYVGNLGYNRLLINNGDGTFEDVTSRSGAAGPNVWTTSCAIVDVNGDRLPDIYAVNYLGEEAVKTICRTAESEKKLHACIPKQFPSEDDTLFINLGDGRFRNMSRDAGILLPDGKGLGIVAGDLTGNGAISLFIANDSTSNYLFVNQSKPGAPVKFVDQALTSGLAYNQSGLAQACMGVAVDDVDRNGLIDLFITNFTEEGSILYSQQSDGLYEDRTREAGLFDPTVMILGFGTQTLDADLDGWPDLIQTNGHIDTYDGVPFGYEMQPQFFRNEGQGKFKELPASVLGPFFAGKYLGRGLARIDWNQDGLEDVAISHIDVPAAVLTNTTPATGQFLAISLRGTKSARDALGAVVKVKTGRETLVRQLTGGDGYQASNERVLYFGLGDQSEVEGVEIRWPNGETQALPKQGAGQSLLVIEGRSEPVLLWKKG